MGILHKIQNDDNATIKKALSEDIIQARNSKNATNFLGQFYFFMSEYAFFVVILFIILF